MRVLLQRVKNAAVTIEGKTVAQIDQGLLALVAMAPTDTADTMEWMAQKMLKLKIFTTAGDLPASLNLADIQGQILLVSQFTLYADVRKGAKPSFSKAAPPEQAKALYEQFVQICMRTWPATQSGVFGADMSVSLVNDGPYTLWLEHL